MSVSSIPLPPEGHDLAEVPSKLEGLFVPVTDVDRAKDFDQRLRWQLDMDFQVTEQVRAVQFTPPGSPASVLFSPSGGSPHQGLLVVDDIEGAPAEIRGCGLEMSDVFHALPGEEPTPSRDPGGRSYVSQATVTDPDGNTRVLQDVTERVPGRIVL